MIPGQPPIAYLRRAAFAIACAILVLSSSASAETPEDGAIAPPGRWSTEGGSAARTGESASRPVRSRPEAAWTTRLPGEIESEPLVWDGVVLVTTRGTDATRSLHAIRLADGLQIGEPRRFTTDLPLAPGIEERLVVVRAAARRLEILRVGPDGFETVTTIETEDVLGPPLLHASEIHVTVGDSIARYSTTSSEPVWRREGRYRGRPSLRGEHVYTLRYDRRVPRVVSLHRDAGRPRDLFELARHRGEIPRPGSDLRLVVLENDIQVHTPPFGDRAPATFSRAVHVGPRNGRGESARSTYRMAGLSAAFDTRWIAYLDDPETGRFLGIPEVDAPGVFQMLSTGDVHPEFLRPSRPLSVAGEVAFAGARAFEPQSGRILWWHAIASRFRPVPARQALLVVDAPDRLTALRAAGRGRRDALWTPPPGIDLASTVELPGGRLVLRDGGVIVGDFELRRDGGRVVRIVDGRPREGWALDDVLLVEDLTRWPIFVGSEEDLREAVARIDSSERADAYASLAVRATSAGDRSLLERLVRRARTLGVPDARIEPAIVRLSRAPGKRERRRPEIVDEIRTAERRLEARRAEVPFERASAISRAGSTRPLLVLLRDTLERDADHVGASTMVRSLLPESLTGPRLDPIDGLDFLEAREETRIDVIPLSLDGSRAPEELRRARREWRPDLVGFRSPHLLVVTPVAQRPGAIARCLSLGELVCDALGRMFAIETSRETLREPLTLYLYESRQEYLTRADPHTPDASGDGLGLDWTAGFYAHAQNRSHIYLPAGEAAFDEIADTYVHELTHHWVRMHCPLFPFEESDRFDPDGRGYWIVEGFATFVQETLLDRGNRRFGSFDPAAESLSFAAHTSEEQRLPWDAVFKIAWRLYSRLSTEEPLRIPAQAYLGKMQGLSQMRAFYLQSAAVCHYLYHAENGRRRDALLRFLARYYTGKVGAGEIRASFGMSPAELGRAAIDFAREALDAR